MKKRLISFLLSLVLTVSMINCTIINVFAAYMVPTEAKISVNSGTTNELQGLMLDGYDFYSMYDIADALKETDKKFNITYNNSLTGYNLNFETNYVAPSDLAVPDRTELEASVYSESKSELSGSLSKFYVDGDTNKRLAYSVFLYSEAGKTTVPYIRIQDAAQILNIEVRNNEDHDVIKIDTLKDYTVDWTEIESNKYFDFLHSALLGNVENDQIIYSKNKDKKLSNPMASKIMTYLVVKEAIESGDVELTDVVTISQKAKKTPDAENTAAVVGIPDTATVEDLLKAMLIYSSNPASVALAEHVAGSEEDFVNMMKEKVSELGLSTAEFHSAHSYPVYNKAILVAKRQNRMSAKDLFTLASHVVETYPEFLNISSEKAPSNFASYSGLNRNQLIYQLDGVDGLSEGYTNTAMDCSIVTKEITIEAGGDPVRVIAIILGAESEMEKYEKSGTLLQYAKQYLNE